MTDEIIEKNLDFNKEINLTPYKDILLKKKNIKKQINLGHIMDNKKKEILNMLKSGIGLPKNNKTIKPDSLIKFEKGLKKQLINKDSFFFQNNPYLRRKFFNDRKDTFNLKEKIDVGSLVYYNLKNEDNNLENKNHNQKLRYLESSSNYKVNLGNNAYEIEFQKIKLKEKNSHCHLVFKTENNKSRNKTNGNNKNNKRNIFHIKNSKSNTFTYTQNNFSSSLKLNLSNNNKTSNSNLLLTSSLNNSSKKDKERPVNLKIPILRLDSITTHLKTNSENCLTLDSLSTRTNRTPNIKKRFKIKLLDNELSHKNSLKNRLNLKNVILNKITELDNTTNKCNDQLFKIVDSSKIPEKDFKTFMTLDMEELLEFKRKKFDDNDTKNLVYQAKKNNEYEGMDKDKAEILTITDKVTRLPDDVAMFFVDRLAENYNKKKDLVNEVTKSISPILANYRSKENMELREKLENNYFNIERKGATLDFKKDKLQRLYNKIFDNSKEVKINNQDIFNRNKFIKKYFGNLFNESLIDKSSLSESEKI